MLSEKFIKATEKYCTYDKPVAAPYMRKSFELEVLPNKAVLTLTSTGFYRLYINGEEIEEYIPSFTYHGAKYYMIM